MEIGENNGEWAESTDLVWSRLLQAAEQPLQKTLGIRGEVEEGMKRAIPAVVEAMKGTIQNDQIQCQCKQELSVLIPVMVEEAVKKEVPPAVEAVFSKCFQEFMASFPATIGEVLQKMSHNPTSRSLPHDAESPILRTSELRFVGTLPDSFLTLNNIKAEGGVPLMVELVDMSGSRVEVGPESSAKIKIVVLDGDFDVENREEYFNDKVVKPRKDKGPLLKGECDILMIEGVATVRNLAFTDNSSSMRNGKFRLGAKIVKAPTGVAIREAVSDAFRVKEHRLQSYGKEKKLSIDDDIRCLKHIGPNISLKLAAVKVKTVKDFLQLYRDDENALRKNFHVSDMTWSKIVDNAKSCLSTSECYHYHDYMEGISVNNQRFETLHDSHMELINKIRHNAYEKQSEVQQTFIPTNFCPNQTGIGVMYHTDTTVEPGQPEMLPNINCFAPGVSVMPLSSLPEQLICGTRELYSEPQNMGMFANCSVSHMASTSNTQPALVLDESYEADVLLTRCSRVRWKSIQFVVRMIAIAGDVSVKQGCRAQKRQKLG